MVSAGYCVDVIALHSSASKARTYNLNGVNVHTFSLGKIRGSFGRYLFEYVAFFVLAFFKLNLMMKKRRYAVIDVNTLPDFPDFCRYPGLDGRGQNCS